jgi:uncharacterized membrane protein YcaP (DUF421 family)
LLELGMAWWEFPIRAAVVYGGLLLMVRMSGKRTVGQFTPFDLLVVMLLSEAVSNSLSGGDESLLGGLLLAATLLLLNAGAGRLAARSAAAAKLLDGEPVLIGRDGQLFAQALLRHRLSQEDVESALRDNDCLLAEMQLATLEADGHITIMRKR